jgi:signal transduction histidine kinase
MHAPTADEALPTGKPGAGSHRAERVLAGLDAIVWEAATPDRASLTFLGGREDALLGYTRAQWLLDGFWLAAVHEHDRAGALATAEGAAGRDAFAQDYRLIDATGAAHEMRDVVTVSRDAHGNITHIGGVIVEMTERRALERRRAEAHTMEAVGLFAGRLAHDVNNLLTVVSGYAQRLRRRTDLGPAHEDLDQIIMAAKRSAGITRRLLSFARHGHDEPVLIDPAATLTALEPMLRSLIDPGIAIDFQVEPGLPHVLMDGANLEQVAMDLVINADHAMHGSGTLTVAAHSVSLAEADAGRHGVRPGDYVRLSVTDTGAGIAPEVRERIFEPFFTTSEEGANGMGLATIYGIVAGAGGWIDVESVVGQGSSFHIMLPVADLADVPPSSSPGGPTVLLVEDEPALRRLVQRMLEGEGYSVLPAQDGLDAIALAGRHEGPLDLLLTDVVMPGLGGPELVRRLRAVRPDLQVLYMSGYNDSRIISGDAEWSEVELLVKPFTLDELIDRVRELIVQAVC